MIYIEDRVIFKGVTVGCVVPNTSDSEELYLINSLATALDTKPSLITAMLGDTIIDAGYGLRAIKLPDVYRVLARYKPGFANLIYERILFTPDARAILAGDDE